MKILKNKIVTLLISTILLIAIAASVSPMLLAQVMPQAGQSIPSYAHLNVAPNPAGVGQVVTLNMFLLIPTLTSEGARGFTIVEKNPAGTTTTLGPFTSDATGGTYTTIIPDTIGNYTFQFFYAGQNMTNGVYNMPSQSDVVTLIVQQEPIQRSSYPITPQPTNWWQTPVTAENVQEWSKITGSWLGYGSVTFAATGGYNNTGNYNPWTQSVLSGHVLWTKVWAEGGVAGGDLLGNEERSSYWSTSQYWPKYAPVIINGIMYSTHFVETTGYSNGILATDLYTGKDLWTINTTNALRCGMVTEWKTVNAYGVIGPYIWTTGTLPAADTGGRQIGNNPSPYMNTTGTQWNMYSALTGKYVLSIVNGTNPTLTTDEHGNIIGYYINSTNSATPQKMTLYKNAPAQQAVPKAGEITFTQYNPVLVAWNMSQLMANTWGWSPSVNTVIDFGLGVMRATPIQNNTGLGTPTIGQGNLNPALSINGITNGAVMMTTGFTFGQGFGGTVNGFLVVAAMDANTGAQLWIKNLTYADTTTLLPFTRTQMSINDGLWINANMANWDVAAYDARTGAQKWTYHLTGFNGAEPNNYDQFNLKTYNGPGCVYIEGFGGDIWSINTADGSLRWYTNTTALIGDPGIETPYGIWPLWTFSCAAMTNDIAYFAIGHEYNPPLFHGAQLLAVNATDGTLVWSTLDMSIESTSIAYGIMLSRNAYDNQIYAFGKGPSTMTVTAPDIGVTTATPITIRGTIMDISAGASQDAIAKNFPNGIPCVSDESQSHWMEYVYQQQPAPTDTVGVPVTLSVLDANNNFRTIGTTTSDATGNYAYTWTPDIPGSFTLIASFAGSNSYYGSSAETHFYASSPEATHGPTTTPVTGFATTSDVMYIGVAIIVVIIIIGAVLAVLMIRKRP